MKKGPEENRFEGIMWGPSGHQLIAEKAEKLLTDKAANKVKEILSPLANGSLRTISTWADIIKHHKPKPTDDPDTIQFLKDFPNDIHARWHFVDLPLEVTGYDRLLYPTFTREDDIVEILNRCINVLLGKDSIMSKLNALRWITHLVGDIHQPLHVGCGYIDETGEKPRLNFNPEFILANNLSSDHGGNFIILSEESEKELNLHSYWDGMSGFQEHKDDELNNIIFTENQKEIVDLIITTLKNDQKNLLIEEVQEVKKIDQWSKDWATESLVKAREAYQSIVITEKISERKFRVEWEGKESYEKRCLPIVEGQIKLASQRLAETLNKIFEA